MELLPALKGYAPLGEHWHYPVDSSQQVRLEPAEVFGWWRALSK